MDPYHEHLLTVNLTFITKHLDVDAVIREMVARGALREHHVEQFQLLTRTERAHRLVSHLKRSGPTAFPTFIQSLHASGQQHIADALVGSQENTQHGKGGDPVGIIERPGTGIHASSSNTSLSNIPPPTYDEVRHADKYYQTHLPSFVNDEVLRKVPATSGVMSQIQIEGVDTATRFLPLPKFDPSDHYENFSQPKGLALIFNNRKFRTLPTRMGTDVDAKNMQTLLTELGYSVKIKQDHTAREMVNALARFALKPELDRVDSAIIVVLTHGEHGELYGVDDDVVRISDFTAVLNSMRCPALRGKPKLFFLQACRGKSYDAGDCANGNQLIGGDYEDARSRAIQAGVLDPCQVPLTPGNAAGGDAADAVESTSALLLMIADNFARDMADAKELEKRIPADADIFIGYATTPGYVSWRNSSRGSWYIESIINVFRKDAYHEDLLSMMTKVNRMVAEVYASSSGGFKQIPEPCSRLTKKFFFFPGRFSAALP